MKTENNKAYLDCLESPERIKAFHSARSFGSGEAYYEYRRRWDEAALKQDAGEYPVHVDLELSTCCNLQCPYCYTLTEEFKQSVGHSFMDFNLFRKVIDEIVGKVPSVRLSLRGEPTLHPDFIKCIHYAKRKGITEVSTLTNLSMMTPDFFEKVMLAGLDWMTVSFDGLYEEYEKNRAPLKFAESHEKLKKIKEIKAAYNTPKPAVTIQPIWSAIENNPEEFYNMMASVADMVIPLPFINYEHLNNDLYEPDHSYICPQPYQRLTIHVNGEAAFCACGGGEFFKHSIGNITEQTVYELWHCPELEAIRKFHREHGSAAFHLCRQCPLSKKTREDFFTVGGRKIAIKNYALKSEA